MIIPLIGSCHSNIKLIFNQGLDRLEIGQSKKIHKIGHPHFNTSDEGQ